MQAFSERIAAARLHYARALLAHRPKHLKEFGAWALDRGATHAITITPDIYVNGGFDADRDLKPILRRLAKAIAHDIRDIPYRRLSHRAALDRAVWTFGFVETETKTRMVYPHFHGVVVLRPGEERLTKAVLANRWGKGRGAPALRPVFRKNGACPDFDLVRLTDVGGWFDYGMKHTSLDEFTFWSHLDLLGTDH